MSWASVPERAGQTHPAAPRDADPVHETASLPGDTDRSAPGSHHRGAAAGPAPAVAGRFVGSRPRSATGRSERTAPCRRANISCGMASTRSTIALALGSVARASRFSSSVRVSVRSVRISSISPASSRSPGLSGATPGWSYMMIGDDSTTSRRPFAPASTGKVCRFAHPFAAAAAQRRRVQQRQEAPVPHVQQAVGGDQAPAQHLGARRVDRLVGQAFSISTRNRRIGNGAGATAIDRRSRADSGHRVRTTRPVPPSAHHPRARSPRRRER